MRFIAAGTLFALTFCASIYAQDANAVSNSPALVTPMNLVSAGYVSTYLAVSGTIVVKNEDGSEKSRSVTFPVWARKNAIAIPKDRLGELQKLCNELRAQAEREREAAAAGKKVREKWMAFMTSISADQWSSPTEP